MSVTLVEQPTAIHESGSVSIARSCEEQLAAQLGCLASQHHASEYNCLKFGPQGAPVRYIPLSVQMPDHFKQLQDQQARYAVDQAWWPCQKAMVPVREPLDRDSDLACPGSPPLNRPFSMISLQDELMNAMSSSFTPQQRPSRPRTAPPRPASAPGPVHMPDSAIIPLVKTSESHPINVSFLIPMELLPIISAHIILNEQASSTPSPVIFDVPVAFQLHRLVCVQMSPPGSPSPTRLTGCNIKWCPATVNQPDNTQQFSHPHPRVPPRTQSLPPASSGHLKRQSSLVNMFWNQKIVRTSKAIISGSTNYNGFKIINPLAPPKSRITTTASVTDTSTYSLSFASKSVRSSVSVNVKSTSDVKLQESNSAPPRPSPPLAVRDDPQTEDCDYAIEKSWIDAQLPPPVPTPPSPGSQEILAANSRYASFKNRPTTRPPTSLGINTASQSSTAKKLGNLFLSSCPGKKVRLDGPVNGRSGVRRDLRQDLQRIKDLGVGCIVCCLDDEELKFLGAPWDEYSCTADELGLDILRIPTPEGLAPSDPPMLDSHLTRLIQTYTLAGIPILVHCRGGVGRAGLVACCWALKLGLCGWIDTQPVSTPSPSSSLGEAGRVLDPDGATMDQTAVRRDTLQLVERAIPLVRRRRSPKAVETFEQVKFLVDYIELLRSNAKGRAQGLVGELKCDGQVEELKVGSVMEGDIREQGVGGDGHTC